MTRRGGPGGASAAADFWFGSSTKARVALIEKRGKFLVAEPFFSPGPRVAVSRDSRYDAGDLVLVSPGASGRRGSGSRGRVLRRIGRPSVAREVIEALMLDRGLARGFEGSVAREAAAVAGGAGPGSGALVADGRRDLRDLPTFTIDPSSARDFDDAISASVEDGGDGWRVWVHIADVSAYVSPRSPIDREAFARGTSVYVPGAVEPMLPVELSNGVCSLVPGEDRLAVTVEMLVRGQDVVRSSFVRSVIRSDKRLTYPDVDELFAGSGASAGSRASAGSAGRSGSGSGSESGSGDWVAGLSAARAAALALGTRRASAGALVLESAEPSFTFDRAGNVVGVEPVEQTESHRLIEYLMIAANEQVARFLEARRVPALYRVHERPEASAVERLLDQLASLGVPTPPVAGGPLTGQQAADAAGEASAMVHDWVAAHEGRGARALNRVVLRSLKQAYYDDRNRGHSGLQLGSYCHFTSPIRRYPDLICHRALLSAVTGSAPAPEASFVAAAGPACSGRERAAMLIERDADDVARCFLLERFLASGGGEASFEGEIVGVIGAGAFVAFGPEGEFEGLLPVRRMRDDWWELNEHGTALIGTRNGGALRLGDPVSVRVDGVDAPHGRVDLVPDVAV